MVGGNGRTKTLRTIARHADTWNGFGTPDELAELDGVLRAHCVDAGRDPSTIERTSNLWMIIRDSEEEARQVWAATAELNHVPVADVSEPSRPLLGPPASIAARLREYVAAGFSTALVEVPAPYDVETLERLIGEVKPLVDNG
jgi:alkanesulfonate monooxygenase SsuD/methylene tetrahydromethanopterin reductase-like flavin-dependent oxidoreductase (luciferase family)